MLEAIGKELKVLRIRNNYSIEDVANKLNVNRETIRRYENNSNGLSVERLEDTKNNFHYYAKSAEESKIMAELYKERNNKDQNINK